MMIIPHDEIKYIFRPVKASNNIEVKNEVE